MYQYNIGRRFGTEDKQVYKKCQSICKIVEASKKKVKIKEYPSVAVGCYTSCRLYIDTTHSRPNYNQVPILQHALQQIGPIGTIRQVCKYTIGACAEPKVVFYAMQSGCNNMRILKFTTAFRPRTGQKKKYCRNCKDVFGL